MATTSATTSATRGRTPITRRDASEACLRRAPGGPGEPGTVAPAMARRRREIQEMILRSESGKAAGLAAATLANNALQLIFTRVLGPTDYGTLAALVSAFLILYVTGQAVQVAAAREAALDRLGHAEILRAT